MQEEVNVNQFLSLHHIRPSYQRCRIYSYLKELRSHPTADEIYQALLTEIPTLSKTTVYNTLELFIHEHITRPLSIEGNLLRYDANVSPHGHFQCLKCGKVYDFTIDQANVPDLEGFDVRTRNYFFKGLCPACREL